MSAKELVIQRRDWYDRAASRNSTLFYAAKVLQLGAAATVPILALVNAHRIVTASVGALVAVLVGLEQAFRFQERWRNYRSACEQLRTELFLFESGAGPYAAPTIETERERLLAERVASVSSEELERWRVVAARAGGGATEALGGGSS